MNKDLAPPNNISKLYKEISSVLRTARANANLEKALMKVICVICGCSIRHSRIVTHCVTN